MTECEVDLVIIGAGAAGIAAGTRLLENGIESFVVLEAADRIGGRVHTVPYGKGVVDLGAEWVHGKNCNVVYEIAKPFSLLFEGETFFEKSKFSRCDGTAMDSTVTNSLYEIADEIYDSASKLNAVNVSLGKYIETKFWDKVKPLIIEGTVNEKDASVFLIWAEKMYCSIVGSAAWGNISVTENTEYLECEGNQLQIWKQGGYSTVFDLLMKNVPNPSFKLNIEKKIILNKEVKLIDWQNLFVETTCADGTKFKSRRILVTASLGVLKAESDNLFLPALPPGHLNAIKGIGINVIDKIFMEFPYHWWPTGTSGISCMWTPDELKNVPPELVWTTKVFGFYRNDNQPLNVLCGWVGGDAAAAMENLREAELSKHCMALLRKFAGKNVNIPEPLSVLRSSWYTNPYIRGSYSYRTLESDHLNAYPKALATPICNSSGEPVIMFAGEATSDRYFSTVHGAIETGWREADRLLRLRNPESRQVVVVGAGIAGLEAARCLVANGVDTVIVEAQNVAGGRIRSVHTDCGWVELGAQWLHGENTTVYQIAHDHGLLSPDVSVEGLGRYCRADGSAIPREIVDEVAELIEDILESCETFKDSKSYPRSIADELESRFQTYINQFPLGSRDFIYRQELFNWHERFLLIDNSCKTLKQLSAKAWGLYENCGGKHCTNFKKCYRQLIDIMLGDLPVETVRLNKPVRSIEWRPNYEAKHYPRVRIKGDDYVLHAEHVIVTTSLGYLKQYQSSLFNPELPPPLTQAINHLGFANLVKLYLLYKEPWWSASDEGFQLAWTRDEEVEQAVPWARGVQGFDVLPGRPALLCWVGGEEAYTLEKTQEEVISDHVTVLLRQFTGNHEIPKPQHIYRSQWHENEYVLGAYSHVTPSCDELNINQDTLHTPVYSMETQGKSKVPTILLAGEACSLRHYSTVHGAYESGHQQAQVLVDYIKQEGVHNNC